MLRSLIAAGLFTAAATLFGANAKAEPAMWTLSDEDTTINILGTVHLLPPDTEWRSERIDAAFEAADTVCFEVDAVGRALEVVGLTFSRGIMPSGERMTDYLTDEETEEVKAIAAELGIPFPSMNVMQPWFAGLTIEQYVASRAGLAEGVEFLLHPEVLQSGKTLCEMETVEEQLGGLASMSLEEQFKVMRESQEDFEDLGADGLVDQFIEGIDELVDLWLAGDVDGLAAEVTPEAFGSEAYYDALLVTRNENWIPRIEAMLEGEGNILIAVGAAHLAGPDSVITMLRTKGYEIEGP
ncbi:MAG: TraB/GumN family protein [Pseudomonadota bacterium]